MAEFEASGSGWGMSFDASDLRINTEIPSGFGSKFGAMIAEQFAAEDIVTELAANAMAEMGQEMVVAAIEMIETSVPSGLYYRRYGVGHIASAPGEPPAIEPPHEAQQLVDSFYVAPGAGTAGPTIEFGNSAPYSEYTELGTAKMAPRPVIRPAVELVLAEHGIPFLETAE